MYTKAEWQGAKNHHQEKPRCGVCGAPLAAACPRPAGLTATNHEPLCTACGRWFQTIRAHYEQARRFDDEQTTATGLEPGFIEELGRVPSPEQEW